MPNNRRKRVYTAARRERMAKALEYRKQGRSYPQIAETLGVSVTQAHRDVTDALREVTREPAEDVLKIELARSEEQHMRLNAEIARCLKRLADGGPDVKWVDQIRKLIESQNRVAQTRHRLNGFDMGVHVDASVNVEEQVQAMFATIMNADPEEFGG